MVRTTSDGRIPKLGDVYNMYFVGTGSEQSGWRPGIVFQNNIGNKFSPNIIALPLTSSLKRSDLPTHVLLKSEDTGLKLDSVAICENPERMSKDKIGRYITTLPNDYMRQVVVANMLATSSVSLLDENTVIETWKKAIEINNMT